MTYPMAHPPVTVAQQLLAWANFVLSLEVKLVVMEQLIPRDEDRFPRLTSLAVATKLKIKKLLDQSQNSFFLIVALK